MNGNRHSATALKKDTTGSGRTLRPEVRGRFLFSGTDKVAIRGVTYGPFAAEGSGQEYHDHASVRRDFGQMAALGLNAIRTYTVPPRWLLDDAADNGLRVMVGLPWEQHVTFLDDPALSRAIVGRIREGVRACAGHPAILCYALGNEIPASIVRWHGAARIEQFIRKLYLTGKAEEPDALFTYVNYPSTEYLQLPFLDIVCFNVYLHSQQRLTAYLARLLNVAGDRPVIISEVGFDSQRNGILAQARMLEQQIRTISAAGCSGTFVFAWTDEWHRGGCPIDDWDFGLTRRDRTPKPALNTAIKAFSTELPETNTTWPRFSVVLCTFNGQRYIAECLEALETLDYPDYEVIVVDDGSTDATPEIAACYPVRLIRTENRGLSSARNTGLSAATGEIVAFIDDDAYPDREWLKRLAMVFMTTEFSGVGGPNIPPPGDSLVADCVAHAPGGPIHVLLSDREAEHIPGCNMAFRRAHLLAIGGFDPQFRTAGDDVDVCWRVSAQGWKLGFCPTATVFHHRRDSLQAYWKQQVGYGKAEALLERKWPDKYNAAGHLTWSGRIYNAKGVTPLWWRRGRIYQGTWGTAAYQRIYQPAATLLGDLPLLPEWYLVISFLAMLSLIGVAWRPLLATIPVLVLATGLSILQACINAAAVSTFYATRNSETRFKTFCIGVLLHLMQPLARLCGRLKYGLHPWRRRGTPRPMLPRMRVVSIWSEEWCSPEDWLRYLQNRLRAEGTVGFAGGAYDNWDLEIQGGMLAGVRTRMAVEEHGAGRQMLRFKIWPRCSPAGLLMTILIACFAAAALADSSWVAAAVLGSIVVAVSARMFYECTLAIHNVMDVLRDFKPQKAGAELGAGAKTSAKAVALRAIAPNSQ